MIAIMKRAVQRQVEAPSVTKHTPSQTKKARTVKYPSGYTTFVLLFGLGTEEQRLALQKVLDEDPDTPGTIHQLNQARNARMVRLALASYLVQLWRVKLEQPKKAHKKKLADTSAQVCVYYH